MKNLFKGNSDKASEIMMKVKLTLATLAVSSYAMNHEKLGFWMLASVGIADVIVSIVSKRPDGKV